MHTLITDVIETCGGSARPQKLLNQLGACASIDPHASYVQYRAQKIKEGPMASYPLNSFIMLVSADNLDFKHCFARIYSEKQQLSWHGTTVQLLKPQPQQLLHEVTMSTELPFKRLHSSLTPHTTHVLYSLAPLHCVSFYFVDSEPQIHLLPSSPNHQFPCSGSRWL